MVLENFPPPHVQTCTQCGLYFCRKCLHGNKVCRKCNVFACPVMEKHQLEGLSSDDLWHFIGMRSITNISRSADMGDLIDCILGWQARDLATKAEKAQLEWRGREREVRSSQLSSDGITVTIPRAESEAACSRRVGFAYVCQPCVCVCVVCTHA